MAKASDPSSEQPSLSRAPLHATEVTSYRPSRLFMILGGFFVANALVAEFIGVKIFSFEDSMGWEPFNFNLFGQEGALQFSAGVILWPVVFVMTDIINEYYGMRGIRMLSYLAAGLIAYAFLMIYGAIHLAPADWWVVENSTRGVPDMQAAFERVFGQGLLMIIASLSAFLLAQLTDVLVFHRIKKATGEKWVGLRATGSTLISQLVDTFVVLFIAFKLGRSLIADGPEPWPWGLLLAVATVQYTYKFIVAVALTPLIYVAHHRIDRYLGHDTAEEMKRKAAQ